MKTAASYVVAAVIAIILVGQFAGPLAEGAKSTFYRIGKTLRTRGES